VNKLDYIHRKGNVSVYINTFTSNICGIERHLIGISEQAKTRVTTIGEFRGIHIAIDNFKDKVGNVLQKRYVLWNDSTQLVWYKNRRQDGKFDILV
jgi:hypothetical protein